MKYIASLRLELDNGYKMQVTVDYDPPWAEDTLQNLKLLLDDWAFSIDEAIGRGELPETYQGEDDDE